MKMQIGKKPKAKLFSLRMDFLSNLFCSEKKFSFFYIQTKYHVVIKWEKKAVFFETPTIEGRREFFSKVWICNQVEGIFFIQDRMIDG